MNDVMKWNYCYHPKVVLTLHSHQTLQECQNIQKSFFFFFKYKYGTSTFHWQEAAGPLAARLGQWGHQNKN